MAQSDLIALLSAYHTFRCKAITNAESRLGPARTAAGWSAINLLLRRPDLYEQAAVFNAPLTLTHPEEDTPLAEAFSSKEEMRPYALPALVEEETVALPFRTGKPRIALFAGPNEGLRDDMLSFSHMLGQNVRAAMHPARDSPHRTHARCRPSAAPPAVCSCVERNVCPGRLTTGGRTRDVSLTSPVRSLPRLVSSAGDPPHVLRRRRGARGRCGVGARDLRR